MSVIAAKSTRLLHKRKPGRHAGTTKAQEEAPNPNTQPAKQANPCKHPGNPQTDSRPRTKDSSKQGQIRTTQTKKGSKNKQDYEHNPQCKPTHLQSKGDFFFLNHLNLQ
jgi:hypothetical protein